MLHADVFVSLRDEHDKNISTEFSVPVGVPGVARKGQHMAAIRRAFQNRLTQGIGVFKTLSSSEQELEQNWRGHY